MFEWISKREILGSHTFFWTRLLSLVKIYWKSQNSMSLISNLMTLSWFCSFQYILTNKRESVWKSVLLALIFQKIHDPSYIASHIVIFHPRMGVGKSQYHIFHLVWVVFHFFPCIWLELFYEISDWSRWSKEDSGKRKEGFSWILLEYP